MPHEHTHTEVVDESRMWMVCDHAQNAEHYHVMPVYRVVVCDACLEAGPESFELDQCATTCPVCLEDDIGPIDWSRWQGYRVDRN